MLAPDPASGIRALITSPKSSPGPPVANRATVCVQGAYALDGPPHRICYFSDINLMVSNTAVSVPAGVTGESMNLTDLSSDVPAGAFDDLSGAPPP